MNTQQKPDAWVSAQRPGLLGTALMLYTLDVDAADEDLFDTWYTHEHMPERVGVPGFLRGRRYVRQEGTSGPKHLTIYETTDVDVFSSAEYLRRLDNPTALTRDVVTRFRDPHRSVMRVLYSHGASVGREVSIAHLAPSDSGALRSWLQEAAQDTLADPRLCGLHLAEADLGATAAKSSTSEGKGAAEETDAACVLMVDGVAGTGHAIRTLIDAAAERGLVGAGPDVATYDYLVSLLARG